MTAAQILSVGLAVSVAGWYIFLVRMDPKESKVSFYGALRGLVALVMVPLTSVTLILLAFKVVKLW